MIKNVTNRASFLRLPAELRLCIYGYLLGSLTIPLRRGRIPSDVVVNMIVFGLEYESSETHAAQTTVLPNGRNLWPCRGLFLACHQTYDEMERELLRLHSEAFDALGAICQQRHNMQLEVSPLSRLNDTNHITIGIPCNRVARDVSKIKESENFLHMHQTTFNAFERRPIYEVDPAFEGLVGSLLNCFLSFNLYLADLEQSVYGFKTESDLHHIMFETFVEHLAGRGQIYKAKSVVNGRRVTPRGTSLSWGTQIQSAVQRWPQMLEYEYRF